MVLRTHGWSEQITTSRQPYSCTHTEVEVIIKLMRGVIPERPHSPEILDDLWGIMTQCWSAEPTNRLTMVALQQGLLEDRRRRDKSSVLVRG